MTTLAPSFLIGSSSFRTTVKTCMSLNFKQNQPQTVKLNALERLEKPTQTYNERSVMNGSSSFKLE